MADLLIWANKQATAARAAGQVSLSGGQLAEIRSWYRGAVAKGIPGNQHRRSQIAKDGLRLARRFRDKLRASHAYPTTSRSYVRSMASGCTPQTRSRGNVVPLNSAIVWWQVMGSNHRRLSRRFYRYLPNVL